MSTGNLLLDEMMKMNEKLLKLEEKLTKIEENTKLNG